MSMKKIMTRFDFSKDPLLTANIENSLRQGSGDILEDSAEGIFLYDREGHVFCLYAPTELGKAWLRKHEALGYELLILYDDALIAYAAETYGLTIDEKCRQVVWTAAEPPLCTNSLSVRAASEEDIDLCLRVYRHSSEEDIRKAVGAGNVLLGYEGEQFAGMIGLHSEGSIGMLEVLPAYRRKGYGAELEKAMIASRLRKGCIPFAHVYLSNAASLALQEHIGMACSEGTLTWLFPEEE